MMLYHELKSIKGIKLRQCLKDGILFSTNSLLVEDAENENPWWRHYQSRYQAAICMRSVAQDYT
jgi:hypothetical protein